MRIHVINHHFWPDGSPSAVLEEELADSLRALGHDTVLICGSGKFHDSERPAPATPIRRLSSGETGKRNSQLDILRDYFHYYSALQQYVRAEVKPNDAVLATSSPFLNVFLISTLKKYAPGCRTIFHLHDYLPSNLRSLGVIHRFAAPFLKWLTDRYLRQWGLVVLCAGNIAYHGHNRTVARFWPTIGPSDRSIDTTAKRALYAGNLGIAHDMPALISELDRLHAAAWEIDFFVDGPKAAELPSYVVRHPFVSGDEYLDVLYSHPVHLVCGVRRDGTGAFPSKTINSLYVGAEVRPCGFRPEMLRELEALRATSDLAQNRQRAAQQINDWLAG